MVAVYDPSESTCPFLPTWITLRKPPHPFSGLVIDAALNLEGSQLGIHPICRDNSYNGNVFEVSSVGIEKLYTDPLRLKDRDPMLFSFAVRQLFGKEAR